MIQVGADNRKQAVRLARRTREKSARASGGERREEKKKPSRTPIPRQKLASALICNNSRGLGEDYVTKTTVSDVPLPLAAEKYWKKGAGEERGFEKRINFWIAHTVVVIPRETERGAYVRARET